MLALAMASAIFAAPVNDREIECLAKNIYYEARNESVLAQLYVAHVTINRVLQPYWPDTICEVVWQAKQFSWTQDGKPDNPYEKDTYARIKDLAKNLLFQAKTKYRDITGGAVFYHRTDIRPPRISSKRIEKTGIVGSHVFYRFKSKPE